MNYKKRLDNLEDEIGADNEPIVVKIMSLDEDGNAVQTGQTVIENPTPEQRRQFSQPIKIVWDDNPNHIIVNWPEVE
jgi:hypothetical protein